MKLVLVVLYEVRPKLIFLKVNKNVQHHLLTESFFFLLDLYLLYLLKIQILTHNMIFSWTAFVFH